MNQEINYTGKENLIAKGIEEMQCFEILVSKGLEDLKKWSEAVDLIFGIGTEPV